MARKNATKKTYCKPVITYVYDDSSYRLCPHCKAFKIKFYRCVMCHTRLCYIEDCDVFIYNPNVANNTEILCDLHEE